MVQSYCFFCVDKIFPKIPNIPKEETSAHLFPVSVEKYWQLQFCLVYSIKKKPNNKKSREIISFLILIEYSFTKSENMLFVTNPLVLYMNEIFAAGC